MHTRSRTSEPDSPKSPTGYNEHAANILSQSELARGASGGPRGEGPQASHSNGVQPMQSSSSPSPQRTTSLSADAPAYVPTPGAIKQLSNSQKFVFQSTQVELALLLGNLERLLCVLSVRLQGWDEGGEGGGEGSMCPTPGSSSSRLSLRSLFPCSPPWALLP